MAQFYADRHPDRVAGLVFIDPIAIPGYVDWFGPEVDDGTGGSIDMERTTEDWERIGSFGSTPLFVLTQGFAGQDASAPERFRVYFRGVHDELAGRSSDAIHVIAEDSGHVIQETSPTWSSRRSRRSWRPFGLAQDSCLAMIDSRISAGSVHDGRRNEPASPHPAADRSAMNAAFAANWSG